MNENKYNEKDDETLVVMARKGDESAYSELVVRYTKTVLSAAFSITHEIYTAEDAVQETFVTAWLKLGELNNTEKFASWVVQIAKNRTKNIVMRRKKYISYDLLYDNVRTSDHTGNYISSMYSLGFGGSENSYDPFNDSDTFDLLHEKLDSLPGKIRDTVKMYYLNGFTVAELAKKMSVSEGTIKWRLHEGRRMLKKGLENMDNRSYEKHAVYENELPKAISEKIEIMREAWFYDNIDYDQLQETLRDINLMLEPLAESRGKSCAAAEIKWYEYKLNEESFSIEEKNKILSEIKELACKCRNEEILDAVLSLEDEMIPFDERIEFITGKQVPYLEVSGCDKALGRELYRLGYCYFFLYGDSIRGFQVYRRGLELLPKTDIYHAALLSAIESENERNFGYLFCGSGGVLLRKYGSKLKLCKMNGYNYEENTDDKKLEGNRAFGKCFDIILAAAFCDRTLFDSEMKPGNVYTGSEIDVVGKDKKCTIIYKSNKEAIITSCGSFENCDLWITERYGKIKNYYKRGVGIVYQEHKVGSTKYIAELKTYHVKYEADDDRLLPLDAGNRWEYELTAKSASGEILQKTEYYYEVTAEEGDTAVLKNVYRAKPKSADDCSWREVMLRMRYEYCEEKPDGQYLSDVSELMKHAELLADTKYRKIHTAEANEVMRRIFDTDVVFNPKRTESGHWNFFSTLNVEQKENKIFAEIDCDFSFEWKEMRGTGEGGSALLQNDIYGILIDNTGYLWSDEWMKQEKISFDNEIFYDGIICKTTIVSEPAGKTETAAGIFDNCILVMVDTAGDIADGLKYRIGRRKYWFAPGVGIVRTVKYHDSGKIVYELDEYEGVDEGYMPVCDRMTRIYRAVGLDEKYIAEAKYTYIENKEGMVIIENRTGNLSIV